MFILFYGYFISCYLNFFHTIMEVPCNHILLVHLIGYCADRFVRGDVIYWLLDAFYFLVI